MANPIRLDSKAFAFAVEHALETHALAEQERARVAACADLETLRSTLRELGLPDADIDEAIATLEQAMRAEAGKRRMRGPLVAVVTLLLITVLTGLTWFLATPSDDPESAPVTAAPAQPTGFVSVRYQGFSETPTQTWSEGTLLGGQAEDALAAFLRGKGLRVVEQLTASDRARLFPASATEPELAAVRELTRASHGVLASFECIDQGSVMQTAMRSYRVLADVRIVDLAKELEPTLVSARQQQVGLGINGAIGCSKGLEKALVSLLPELSAGLDGYTQELAQQ